jgi:hypothetical protein
MQEDGGLIVPNVGDAWRDKDPRSPNRVVVLEVEADRVRIQRPSKKVWVSLKRFAKAFRPESP